MVDAMKLHADLSEWLQEEYLASRITVDVFNAGFRVLNSLWAAAHNPSPPPTMAEDMAALEKAQRQHS